MLLPERIDTERLTLRPPQLTDAAAIYTGYAGDPLATRYLTWKPHVDIAVTRDFLHGLAGESRPDELVWALCERARSEHVIGMLSLRPAGFKAELGYVLAPALWGRGYMAEAVRAVVEHGLGAGLYRVAAFCDVENFQSARVLEKAGMQREGLLRRYALHPNLGNEPRDVFMFAACR